MALPANSITAIKGILTAINATSVMIQKQFKEVSSVWSAPRTATVIFPGVSTGIEAERKSGWFSWAGFPYIDAA